VHGRSHVLDPCDPVVGIQRDGFARQAELEGADGWLGLEGDGLFGVSLDADGGLLESGAPGGSRGVVFAVVAGQAAVGQGPFEAGALEVDAEYAGLAGLRSPT
jgi:hypothetical protein